ncbi:carbohydrate ABC transporter permease [Caproicibacter fermentans]|uniref:Sugar ABC transporter permease n=1 Tax=Caproicibacter fermentans TaxID=2576756 RepID=A0A7G8TBF7_9FIRM|nr:sugar ABC transporter permease [Caproicibacter fermentans]QNK40948.1 sugar ABC transporter permease [Caproicibacter fermentans]
METNYALNGRVRTSAAVSKKSGAGKAGAKLLPYAMVAPSIAVFCVFILYPIGYMIYLSFFHWNLIGPKTFIGLENYLDLLHDADFWQVMGNSFLYMFLMVSFSLMIPLLLAFTLKQDTRLNKFLQGVLFTPYIVSLVSISYVWMWMMDSDYGLINYLLHLFGMSPVGWLSDPSVALPSLIFVSVWKGIGYNTIIFISSMETIPQYLYEAANLDHAKKHTVFFRITLPMISPTIFFLTLMNIISAFKVFETVNLMTQGGPMNSTNTLVYDIYQYGFQFYKIGYASAMGVVLMGIIGICTVLYFRALSRRIHYR